MAALKDDVLASLAAAEEEAAPVLTPPVPRAVVRSPTTARTTRRALRPVHLAAGAGAALAGLLGLYALSGHGPGVAPPAASATATEVELPTIPGPRPPPSPAPTPLSTSGRREPTPLGTAAPWPAERQLLPTASNGAPLGAEPTPAVLHTPTAARREAPRAHDGARPPQAGPGPRSAPAPTSPPPPAPGLPTTSRLTATSTAAAEAILGQGQIAFDHGDYPGAVRRGREAIAAGAVLGGRLLVGDAYYRLERYPDAMREYEAALALEPANPTARRRLDLAREAAGRPR
jgi:hypothetical protein